MFILIGLAAVCLATVAAYFAAERRGRTKAWAAFTLMFSPALLILVCLPKRNEVGTPKRRYAIPLEILGVLGLLVVAGGAAYEANQTGTFGGVPRCNSSFTMDTAKRAFAGAPGGKLLGLAIIDLQDIQEISADETGRQCRGTALLNNTTEHPVVFDIKKHDDLWLVTIRLIDSYDQQHF